MPNQEHGFKPSCLLLNLELAQAGLYEDSANQLDEAIVEHHSFEDERRYVFNCQVQSCALKSIKAVVRCQQLIVTSDKEEALGSCVLAQQTGS